MNRSISIPTISILLLLLLGSFQHNSNHPVLLRQASAFVHPKATTISTRPPMLGIKTEPLRALSEKKRPARGVGWGRTTTTATERGTVALHLWKKLLRSLGDKNENEGDNDQNEDGSGVSASVGDGSSSDGDNDGNDRDKEEEAKTTTVAAVATTTETATTKVEPTETPLSRAKKLREQAKRVRLEAERMDVVLTLEKITKIERELESPKVPKDEDRRKQLQEQMKELKKRLEGGDAKTKEEEIETKKNDEKKDKEVVAYASSLDSQTITKEAGPETTAEEAPQLSTADLQARIESLEKVPEFMKKVVADARGLDTTNGVNTTELVLATSLDELSAAQNSTFYNAASAITPELTPEDIQLAMEKMNFMPGFLKKMWIENGGYTNETELAISILESSMRKTITQEDIDKKLKQIKWMPFKGANETKLAIEYIEYDRFEEEVEKRSEEILKAKNSTTTGFDFMDPFGKDRTPTENLIEGCFPKECRREGEEPTEAQLKIVLEDVLAKNSTWITNKGKAEKVPGGYVIRGSTKYETGRDLIAAIDANMAASRIRNRVSLFYVFDPTPVTEEQQEMGDRPPVLFLMGPKVVNDPTPLRSGLVSTLGIITLWSNAIYPLLLNEKYMKLVEEQISLSDASMPSNIDFINDLAYPIFIASLGIHIAHEVAHKLVANANGMNITFPTLIPSFVTGITGSVTSLTAPPKDKQALIDFALVGPLAGMAVSTILLYIGVAITASTGAEAYANLPALPLSILRQSSLAGGILDAVIPGIVNVPDAAGATKPLSDVFIPLDPLAIAGYFGLMVNAVNLLPLGRTDGGRVALALFGRTGFQVVAFFTSLGILSQGILFGSDILLFYFSFVIFFQGDIEIPQQNEVDDIDFSRVLLATAAGVLVLLTLIPM